MEDISLIVTCHNKHIYLNELCAYISECKKLGWQFEVIILDSSEDEYSPCIECSYVRIPNLGPSFARNHGAKLSTNDWILFCDADDFFNPRVMGVFENNPHLNSSNLICFDFLRVQNKEGLYPKVIYNLMKKCLDDVVRVKKVESSIYFIENFHPVHSVLLRKQIFEKVTFDTEQWYIEDVNFYLKIFKIDSSKCFIITSEKFISLHRDFDDKSSLSSKSYNGFWAGVAKNYNYINDAFKLSIIERFRLINCLVVSLKSIDENTKNDFFENTRNIVERNKWVYLILRVEFLRSFIAYSKRIFFAK